MPERRTSNGFIGMAVAIACAVELLVMGRAVTPLVVGLLVSYLLWISQTEWRPTRDVLVVYITAVFVQCLHLIEEFRTGFYSAFPPVLGGQAWSPTRFLAFNLIWLAVFVVAGIGMTAARRPAFLVALFLGLGGGIANGLGHLALAARRGGYFPGAYTAVLALFAGSALLRKLLRPESHRHVVRPGDA
jgi:tryptophan-rich sensory protein